MDLIESKINSWKDKLLSVKRSNRLIKHRILKKGNLYITYPNMYDIWKQLVEKSEVFEFKLYDGKLPKEKLESENLLIKTVPDYTVVENSLNTLKKKRMQYLEELGLNLLYTVFGFLEWKEGNSEESYFSPLVLVPTNIYKRNVNTPYEISSTDEDILINPTLSLKLKIGFGIDLPKYNPSLSLIENLNNIKKVFPNGNIIEKVCLDIFNFQKVNIYEDFNKYKDLISNNKIVNLIVGDRSITLDNNIDRDVDFDKILPENVYQILDADYSQEVAIQAAIKGKSFILQGPPGTGKSQTISNIISEFLARGKNVLFVSEKLAALEVVYKRLDNMGLGKHCIRLHGNNIKKTDFYNSIKESVNREYEENHINTKKLDELVLTRDYLNEYVKELHKKILPLNKSFYDVYGILSKIQIPIDIKVKIENIETYTEVEYDNLIYILQNYETNLKKLEITPKNNPWKKFIIKDDSVKYREELESNIVHFNTYFDTVKDSLYDFIKNNFIVHSSYNSLNNVLNLYGRLEEFPYYLSTWNESNNLNKIKKQIDNDTVEHSQALELMHLIQGKYKEQLSHEINEDDLNSTININKQIDYLNQIILNDEYLCKLDKNNNLDSFEKYKEYIESYTEHYGIIKEYEELILNDYDNDIFNIDIENIAKRFKMDYTSFFRFLKKQYRRDFYEIKSHYKKFDKFTYNKIILFLEKWLIILRENEKNKPAIDFMYNIFEKDVFKNMTPKDLNDKFTQYLNIRDIQNLLNNLRDKVSSIENSTEDNKSIFGKLYIGLHSDFNEIKNLINKVLDFREYYFMVFDDIKFLENLISLQDFRTEISKRKEFLKIILFNIETNLNWIGSNLELNRNYFIESDYKKYNIFKLIELLKNCIKNIKYLEESIQYNKIKSKVLEYPLNDFINEIEGNELSENIVDIFNKNFFDTWFEAFKANYKAINNFDVIEHEKKLESFKSLDKEQFKIASERIDEILNSNKEKFYSNNTSPIKREILKRSKPSIRNFISENTKEVLVLKPCLMMSPLSVSTYINPEKIILDLVIFDEASQVTTENAIGAIIRGKQVIIAGDNKQLPPTDFFSKSMEQGEYDSEDDNNDDFESILDEASLLPSYMLKWHYRSKHESLITFSNNNLYDGKLVTFPSTHINTANIGIEFDYVEEGYIQDGINTAEAIRIVDLIFEHFQKYGTGKNKRSLGVITFGSKQNTQIEELLNKRRKENPSYEVFFNEEEENHFFIKNLENVQGDERDTIILSVTYGKRDTGSIDRKFGPLNNKGGERRLNVAITRAIYNMIVVSSVKSYELLGGSSESDSFRLVIKFLEYAQNGYKSLETMNLKYNKMDSPFEISVYNFLASNGFIVDTQVGCSGFRIDLAIKDKNTNQYVLGIECDGAMYHSSKNARERDRLRQNVLEHMGWKIYRIWSTDWYYYENKSKEKLLNACKDALDSSKLTIGCK